MQARRVGFDFGGVERHFVGGDILLSHLTALFSASFPEGEDAFVRSVRRVRDRIGDPELQRQVAGFIGQEAMHGRQHRAFNGRLAELGYPTRLVDRSERVVLRLNDRLFSPATNLAFTAALEHVTATFAELLLTDDRVRAMFADDDVRRLWEWHALEELEHKAVAFEVFQHVSGDQRLRVRIWRVVLTNVVPTLAGLAVSLALDPAARSPRRLRASWRFLKASPFASRELWRRLRDYERPDFHPDDRDTAALVADWRRRLFAAGV